MTAYTIIPGTSIDADSVADVALMTALRDNPIAIAEGDATAPPITKVQLGSTSTAGTQSVGDNSTKIATTAFCEAGFVNNDLAGAGQIGSIQLALWTNASTISGAATVPGSGLAAMYQDMNGVVTSSGGFSGTWRSISGLDIPQYAVATFQRIS